MADLDNNTSLKIALNEIEKKAIQAETDRNNLETMLRTKNVEIVPGAKMTKLIDYASKIKTVTKTVASDNYLFLRHTDNPVLNLKNTRSTSYVKMDEITLTTEGSIRYENIISSMNAPGYAISFLLKLIRGGRVVESKEFTTVSQRVLVSYDFNNIQVGDKITAELKCYSSSANAACLWGVLKGDIVR